MTGKQRYKILCMAHSRTHLLEHAKYNGVVWKEADHEGINWMRASNSIIDYLEENEDFYLDDMNTETAGQMLELYEQIKELHKQTMHMNLRSAMHKLSSENPDANVSDIDLLNKAHEHLDSSGGADWRNKVNVLSIINNQITYLNNRLENMQSPEGSTEEGNPGT